MPGTCTCSVSFRLLLRMQELDRGTLWTWCRVRHTRPRRPSWRWRPCRRRWRAGLPQSTLRLMRPGARRPLVRSWKPRSSALSAQQSKASRAIIDFGPAENINDDVFGVLGCQLRSTDVQLIVLLVGTHADAGLVASLHVCMRL